MNAPRASVGLPQDQSRKSVFTLAAAILLVAILGWLSFSAREADLTREAARRSEARAMSVLLASNAVENAILDAESGQRGYLLTGDADFRQRFEDGRRRLPAAISRLRLLYAPDSSEAERIGRIEDLADRRLRWLDKSVAVPRVASPAGEPLLSGLRGGRQAMDDLTSELEHLQASEQAALGIQQALARRTQMLAGQWRTLLTSFSLVLCLLCGLALWGLYQARREVREQRLLAESNLILAQGRKLLQSIIDSNPDAIFVKDRRGRVMFANRRFREVISTPLPALTGVPLPPASDPQEAARLADAHVAAIQRGEERLVEVHLNVEGKRRLYQTRKIPWMTDGEIGGVIGVASDITDVRSREAELEHRVAQRTRELETALRSVQREMAEREAAEETVRQMQRIESLGQLTGGIAHDFNNMLAVITGSLEAARLKLRGPARQAIGPLIANALEGAARAAGLTARLLAFARQQSLRPCHVEINPQIEKTCELLERTLSGKITVDLDLDPAAGWTEVDVTQLESALVNLAVNARDAMPDGGRITIATRRQGERIKISVADTGTGMTPDQLNHAFEPFFTTKEPGKGTGLGLSQVHGFVAQSGGEVELRSQPGEGTTVTLLLPAFAAAQPCALQREAPQCQIGGGETVLLVEDEALVRHSLKVSLETLGYQVIAAGSGDEALAMLEADHSIALMITDIAMPGMNGRDLADAARQLHPGLAVLLTTGYEQNQPENGGLPVLVKPYLLEDLASAVGALLHPRAAEKGNLAPRQGVDGHNATGRQDVT